MEQPDLRNKTAIDSPLQLPEREAASQTPHFNPLIQVEFLNRRMPDVYLHGSSLQVWQARGIER